MDDDDLRRGKPTVHRAFDESTAVLAGDCFHDLAFEIIADPATHEDPFVRAELVLELARASGPQRDGRRSDARPGRRGAGARHRFDHPAAAAEDRRADRIRGRGGLHHGPAAARGAHALSRLCPRHRPGLPDRRRSARPCRRRSRGRQAAAQGRSTPARRRSCRCSARIAPGAQCAMLVDQAIEHLQDHGEEADLLRAVARYVEERDR